MAVFDRRTVLAGMAALPLLVNARPLFAVDPYGPENAAITVVVMDPMALPLACDCVQGYAQRKYEVLADYLKAQLGQSVRVVWAEALEVGLQSRGSGKKTIVIGKDSVVRQESKGMKLAMQPVAQLTDMNGGVLQHGIFVVSRDNPAATMLDLEGYQVLWGPDKCDEKSAAPKAKLKELEIETQPADVCETCSVAAKKLLAMSPNAKVAAVISSYAEPLLAGCGTIKKGDLRVVGRSDEVPFVSLFADANFSESEREQLQKALLAAKNSKDLMQAMETRDGFVAYGSKKK